MSKSSKNRENVLKILYFRLLITFEPFKITSISLRHSLYLDELRLEKCIWIFKTDSHWSFLCSRQNVQFVLSE